MVAETNSFPTLFRNKKSDSVTKKVWSAKGYEITLPKQIITQKTPPLARGIFSFCDKTKRRGLVLGKRAKEYAGISSEFNDEINRGFLVLQFRADFRICHYRNDDEYNVCYVYIKFNARCKTENIKV